MVSKTKTWTVTEIKSGVLKAIAPAAREYFDRNLKTDEFTNIVVDDDDGSMEFCVANPHGIHRGPAGGLYDVYEIAVVVRMKR